MNALGKVLTVFVFLGSLVWLGFTAAVFATRSNWQEATKQATKDAADAKQQADNLRKQIEEERKTNAVRTAALEGQVVALGKQRDDARRQYAKLVVDNTVTADALKALQPTVDGLQQVNVTLQKQADTLTAQNKDLTEKRDAAILAQQKAENERQDAKLELNVTQRALEDAIDKARGLAEASRGGAAAADADFRGDVIQVDKDNKDIIVFSGGANAGVKAGKRYVVRRAVAPFYVGTVVVLDASNAQFSSGVFTPAAGQKLAGDYVPKKGDTVSSN
jgi:hypothetical protein